MAMPGQVRDTCHHALCLDETSDVCPLLGPRLEDQAEADEDNEIGQEGEHAGIDVERACIGAELKESVDRCTGE